MWLFLAIQASFAAEVDPKTCSDVAEPTAEFQNQCISAQWQAADAELNTAYQALRGVLDAEGKKRLLKAQRAWISYRDAQCTWEGDEFRLGSMETMTRNLCQLDLTTTRVKHLVGEKQARGH